MDTIESFLDEIDNISGKLYKNEILLKPIILYGAGVVGKKMYRILKSNNIDVVCFIDTVICNESKSEEIISIDNFEVKVYHPSNRFFEAIKQNTNVIMSALFTIEQQHKIKKELYYYGFKSVISLNEIDFNFVNYKDFNDLIGVEGYEAHDDLDKDKIKKAFYLLETEFDKEMYIEYIRAKITKNFSRVKYPYEPDMQYLAHDIPIAKDYSRYVDCGAFDGDTIRNFASKGIKLRNIVAFEPQYELQKKIMDSAVCNLNRLESITIFPCGVSTKTEKRKFMTKGNVTDSSKIDENGNDIIQCVSIDEALYGFNPTFIKMDIEGAEIDALNGAKETIIKNHPQLAICVYHRLSDIWEIPLLIKSFYEGYKFYLRSYRIMGQETVLYAFPK